MAVYPKAVTRMIDLSPHFPYQNGSSVLAWVLIDKTPRHPTEISSSMFPELSSQLISIELFTTNLPTPTLKHTTTIYTRHTKEQ
jgi:hypothetical protein